VELDYLPDSEVFVFSMFIPHEDFTPQKNVHSSTWGSAGGVTPLRGSGASGKPPKEKFPCKCIL
jgi:hypothetical protein